MTDNNIDIDIYDCVMQVIPRDKYEKYEKTKLMYVLF